MKTNKLFRSKSTFENVILVRFLFAVEEMFAHDLRKLQNVVVDFVFFSESKKKESFFFPFGRSLN